MTFEPLVSPVRQDPGKPVRRRLILVRWLLFLSFLICITRLYQLQVVESEEWKRRAEEGRNPYTMEMHKRGSIFDRNGNELGISVERRSLYAIPPELQGKQEEVARILAPILAMESDSIESLLNRRSSFVWLKRALEPQVVDQIRDLNLAGLKFRTEFRRVYPKGNLAAHLIGAVGLDDKGLLDNKGLGGLEWAYNKRMAGMEEKVRRRRGRGSSYDPGPEESIGGDSLQLTIDEVVQHVIEQEVDAAWEEWHPDWAAAIVMDPLSGEILGMTNRPTFDNSRVGESDEDHRRNRAAFDLYEPGSTFKIFTFASAVEGGEVKVSDSFTCGGSFNMMNGKFKIRCHGIVHGPQTLTEVFANSCNVCSAQIAQRNGPRPFSSFLQGLGLRKPTDILPGMAEPRALLRPVSRWSLLSLPSISIGQEVALTPLKLLTVACSVLNSGIVMKPLLIKSIITATGGRLENLPEMEARVMKPSTAAEIRNMMRQVITTGTGRTADIRGYNVIGKTGTGQIAQPAGGYFVDRWSCSFIGFVNEPSCKLGVLVVLKNPRPKPGQTKDVSGGMVAGPVFKRIAERILMYRQVLPTRMQVNTLVRISRRRNDYRVPSLTGMTWTDMQDRYSQEIQLQARGNGPLVVKQYPPPQRMMSRSQPLLVFLGTEEDLVANRMIRNEPFMRHLVGKTLREALEMLQGFDIPLFCEGSGFVTEQEPGAGTPISRDMVIRLKLAP